MPSIAGQFPAPGGDNWGLLMSKDSDLTPASTRRVNEAAGPTARWRR